MKEKKVQINFQTTEKFKQQAQERANEMGFDLTNYIKILIAQDILDNKKRKKIKNEIRTN